MANILVLNRLSPLEKTPYPDWLANHNLFLFAAADFCDRQVFAEQAKQYAKARLFDNYDSNGMVEWSALALHREVGIDFVVAGSERDLIRAARLRQKLGLPGQQESSAIAFRDKPTMKEILAGAGLRVPRFKRIMSPLDAIDFAESVGFPVVIKPALGSGSVEVYILRSRPELEDFLKSGVLGGPDAPPVFQIEEFVSGVLYHVDGVVMDGRVRCSWPSRYIDHCVTFRHGLPTGSHTLSPNSPVGMRLNEFVKDCLAAMPLSHDTTFHAEVFQSDAEPGELILCEVASRTAGGPVPEVLRRAFGVDLRKVAIQLQAGIVPDELRGGASLASDALAGWVAFPMPDKPRRIQNIARSCPFPWVSKYSVSRGVGDVVGNKAAGNQLAFDFMASGLVEAASEGDIVQRIEHLISWYEDELQWGEV